MLKKKILTVQQHKKREKIGQLQEGHDGGILLLVEAHSSVLSFLLAEENGEMKKFLPIIKRKTSASKVKSLEKTTYL